MIDFVVDTIVADPVFLADAISAIPCSETDDVDYQWEHILPEQVQSLEFGLEYMGQIMIIRKALYGLVSSSKR
jgi:hypothetical protein